MRLNFLKVPGKCTIILVFFVLGPFMTSIYVDIHFQHRFPNNGHKFKYSEGLVLFFFLRNDWSHRQRHWIENEMKSLWLVRKNEKIV